MVQYWLNVVLLRAVLPATYGGVAIFRPVGLSLAYLLLLLYSPLVPVPNQVTMAGHTGRYLLAGLCFSLLTCLAQFTFQVVLLAMPPYGHFLKDCEFLEKLLRHVGLIRMDGVNAWEIFYWLIPDVVALTGSCVVYCLCRRLNRAPKTEVEGEASTSNRRTAAKTEDGNAKIIKYLGTAGNYVTLGLMCCASSLHPSVQCAFYFLVFIAAGTWWAFHRELRRAFAVVCRIVMLVLVVHIGALLAYQNQWLQELVPTDNQWARYFGLNAYYLTNCTNARDVDYVGDAGWSTYAYPLSIVCLYYALGLQSRYLLGSQKPTAKPPAPVNERTPLMRFGSGRTGLLQDSTGSVIVQEAQHDDSMQLQSLSESTPEVKAGIFEHVVMAIYSIFQLIINSSYLATNILMMTWSIMYHSWTTFALLLWALMLWMVPNKRSSMMKCAPFLVLYSTLLLLVQYVYSMDLIEDELPSNVHGIPMAEIGFLKADELSRWHLVVKCLFLTMFWITMRQYMAERKQLRRSSALRDMAAPLHVSVSTATATMNHDTSEIKSKFMKDVGVLVKKMLTKFWIAVVAIMLFICGITGERMTVFRIIYMSLFLLFVITFQISWTAWRRMMYPFWITVIGYSVIMLILVYTYQFKNFPAYWEYLYIDKDLQMDIGLEIYETKDLFVRLLTPTFFVIITVLQIHYFHDDFLKVTDIDRETNDSDSRRGSLGYSPSTIPIVSPSEVVVGETEDTTPIYNLKQLKRMSRLERIALFVKFMGYVVSFYNYVWLFLEIHIQKIVFISVILLCINDVCAINFFFVLVTVVAINFKRNIQVVTINAISAAIAVLVVAKMLYQIKYIDHNNWNVVCQWSPASQGPFASNNTVYNSAEWVGMRKADPGKLPVLLKGYIAIVTVTTFRTIIVVRQWFHRHHLGEPMDPPQLMFPGIKRTHADKGIPECLKFFFNYGFYKFGLEFCLMGIVAVIGTRLDFYSVLYGMWLLLLFALRRKTISNIWPFFKFFAIVLFPLQYSLVVGPPTWFCIEYPWGESEIMRRLQEWMYFPDPDFPPNARKLICDFILLLMIVRQSLVFRIEEVSTSSGREFAGGHNYSVFYDTEKLNFVNPVKDYVSQIHNWLDVVKRGSMMSLMWITLSIMFLAGTKRTNLFSLGYLIGAFVFLWQGSDFYLRPIKTILKWWNFLIGYNVTVILLKSLLQGVGCVLIKELEVSACWLVQLLGIACLKKFKSSATDLGIEESQCTVPHEDIGMVWDGLCFAFLLMQKRLFKSYYFYHIVDETKAMSILASRGAELLSELHRRRIEFQENIEKNLLQKLKFKMDKIKANQQRIQGPSYRDPQTHKVDTLYPESRPLYRHRAPVTNREAIRSGDYYMFDELEDDDDVTDLIPEIDDRDELDRLRRQGRRMTVSELMSTLLKTDIEIATHVALYGGTQKDALRLRRQSVPMTRKKSSMSYLSARSETDAAATDAQAQTSLESVDVESSEREMKSLDLTKSQDQEEDEGPEQAPEEGDAADNGEEKKVSLGTYLKFIWAVMNSVMVSMTKYLNRFSLDYRYIRKVLAKEKKALKAKPDFRMGMRLGINQIWQPIPMMKTRFSIQEGSSEEVTEQSSTPSQSGIPENSSIFASDSQEPREEEEAELSEVDQPPIIQLAASIWFGILAHSTLLCYFMVFLHQIKNASILSIPLPLMVLFWGSLTIPRPSKTFWVTIIAYTEIIVIVKCIFQLELIPWNQELTSNHPLFGPRIIGVERKPNYALWDLLLLLMIFFHRFMLKSLGQWTTPATSPRKIIPSKLTIAKTRVDGANRGDGESMPKFHWDTETSRAPTDAISSRDIPGNAESDPERSRGTTNEEERLVAVQGEEVDPCDEEFSKTMNMMVLKYLEPMRSFFSKILSSFGKEKTNVYAYMFLCDFFNFILIIFGFSAFGTQQGDGGVTTYITENRVPMPFLMMLLLQFALIVVDRALFLRKSILGKLIFQYFLIIGIHSWMFFILPSVTERQFNDVLPPQIWYMVKCFYLLLAAYQLRHGYPTRILGNFLCKKYTIVNYVLFKGFMLIPFLFELRAVMDWIWTDTSMTIMDWFKMEDIFASIYQIKCMRGMEADFPQPRGVKKSQMSKYLVGGGALFLIIGLIWFPLLLFALGGTVGVSNLPWEVSMNIRIGSYEPIYAMSAQDTAIFQYTEENFKDLASLYARDRPAISFLENYVNTDVAAVKLSGSSRKLWAISPPDKERLKLELESDDMVTLHVEWTVSRKTDAKDASGITTTKRDIDLPAYVNGEFNPVRKILADLLTPGNHSTPDDGKIVVENVVPKFLKVTGRTTTVVQQLMHSPLMPPPTSPDDTKYLYRNITLQLSHDPVCCAEQQWWVVNENCDDLIYDLLLSKVPRNDCRFIMMFLFNDKAFPEGLSFISGLGILGLYTTAVIVISQMMRKVVSEMSPKIMFDDLPYVDRILRLCLDIYLVRESGDLCLEEDLFAKLIFLYRSPETLIRWTRPPEVGEQADEDDQTTEAAGSGIRLEPHEN
ncbi:piezo-type mechanosensitive ion channel component [Orussus abietinus]|uniref:piezo-type mechanosensitive ion channel component n=1 Tax=Orussus abietinus TaxID=222816 RepID=UPI0006257A55|nr:piezo-type mechanosensitive ion channel component [Orussus abietinus]